MDWTKHPLWPQGGLMDVNEYSAIADLLAARAPCNLLIFGAGSDSELWLEINAKGHTLFIEDDPVWAAKVPGNVIQVNYQTRLRDWQHLLLTSETGSLKLDLPESFYAVPWDVILIDGPRGYQPEHPGRMKSIYLASILAEKGQRVDVFIHDCERAVEHMYSEVFLMRENLVQQVNQLRHFRYERGSSQAETNLEPTLPSRSLTQPEVREKPTYKFVLVSYDARVSYTGRTLDEHGIGGSYTSRIRLMETLVQQGHQVTAYINCDAPTIYKGVDYRHFRDIPEHGLDCDVVMAYALGPQGIAPLLKLSARTRLKILRLSLLTKPPAFDESAFDYLYVGSNFQRQVVVNSWPVSERKLFVCNNGVESDYFQELETLGLERDPFEIVSLGHPNKNLLFAISILNQLRRHDPRFHLEVYGDHSIWRDEKFPLPNIPGVTYHGTITQRQLAHQLFRAGFCIALQYIPETFGNAVQEAKRAGVLVMASKLACFPELIRDGHDGFLFAGDPALPITQKQVVHTIVNLVNSANEADALRRNAMRAPQDWSVIAESYIAHWQIALNTAGNHPSTPTSPKTTSNCLRCNVPLQQLPDGWHCLECGRFYRHLNNLGWLAEEFGSEIQQLEDQLRRRNAEFMELQKNYTQLHSFAEVASREVESLHNAKFYKATSLFWNWREQINRLLKRTQ